MDIHNVHGGNRSRCKKCPTASGICEHGKRRRRCKHCDFSGYLYSLVGNRVRSALRHDKKLSSCDYLGCDIKTFKRHIEDQFVDNSMTWSNKHLWHFDHIIPIKYNIDGDEPIPLDVLIKRLHYTNIQPLWINDNLSKSNRYIG